MHLSVKDMAEILNVSEKTIYRMIQNETIPCFRVGGQWRFDRREVTSWLEDMRGMAYKGTAEEPSTSEDDRESISISVFLQRGGVYFDLPGVTKDEAIRACLERIRPEISGIAPRELVQSVLEREALCPTAVGHGIAFPHPTSFGVFTDLSSIAMCRLKTPVPFGALDKEDVDTLFFIFPKSERRFLRIQSKLIRLLRDEEVLSVIKRSGSMNEMVDVFSAKEAGLFRDEEE